LERDELVLDSFEDHCWQDVISADILRLYSRYRRDVFVGQRPALVAIDLYDLVYQGGAKPMTEIAAEFPNACGEDAWNAIEPTKRIFAAARAARLPIFYTTNETRSDGKPGDISATNGRSKHQPAMFEIMHEFAPAAGDVIVRKVRASAFFGTPLTAYLTQLGVTSVILMGETTSGCLRASAVDAYSHGFHVCIVEECCYDRNILSHKVNLFDLHHKYADVMHVGEVVADLERRTSFVDANLNSLTKPQNE
jgi:maleamate amidohydrolase